ncbi:MAG: hypothetical protein ACOYOF_08285 [Verrucomicrobiaceae bacterium]
MLDTKTNATLTGSVISADEDATLRASHGKPRSNAAPANWTTAASRR